MTRKRQAEVERSFRVNETVLIRWLTSMLADAEAARDVAQNAFIRVWTYAADNNIESPRNLIFKTAARLALNEIRRRKRFSRRNVYTQDLVKNGEELPRRVASNSQTPEDDAVIREEAALALRTIDALPPKVRTAFKLHRFEGLSYQEIADRMQVSKSSVEKYMIEALKSLRETLLPDQTHRSRSGGKVYSYGTVADEQARNVFRGQ